MLPALLPVAPLAGCAERAAPSLILFGAYFPAWMFCALVGVLGAVGMRILMVASGLSQVVPWQLFVCTAVGLILALAVWLIWFGR